LDNYKYNSIDLENKKYFDLLTCDSKINFLENSKISSNDRWTHSLVNKYGVIQNVKSEWLVNDAFYIVSIII
jgi:hypothetical protein